MIPQCASHLPSLARPAFYELMTTTKLRIERHDLTNAAPIELHFKTNDISILRVVWWQDWFSPPTQQSGRHGSHEPFTTPR